MHALSTVQGRSYCSPQLLVINFFARSEAISHIACDIVSLIPLEYSRQTYLYRIHFLLLRVAPSDAPFHILHNDSSGAAIDEDTAGSSSKSAR